MAQCSVCVHGVASQSIAGSKVTLLMIQPSPQLGCLADGMADRLNHLGYSG